MRLFIIYVRNNISFRISNHIHKYISLYTMYVCIYCVFCCDLVINRFHVSIGHLCPKIKVFVLGLFIFSVGFIYVHIYLHYISSEEHYLPVKFVFADAELCLYIRIMVLFPCDIYLLCQYIFIWLDDPISEIFK